jgi:transcriptional regulator with PAS, ATPase and Fis domain
LINLENIHRIVCNLRNISLDPDRTQLQRQIYRGKIILNINPSFSYNIKIDNGKYELVYTSRKMQAVVEMAYQLSSVDSTVLILGETGVGKNLLHD